MRSDIGDRADISSLDTIDENRRHCCLNLRAAVAKWFIHLKTQDITQAESLNEDLQARYGVQLNAQSTLTTQEIYRLKHPFGAMIFNPEASDRSNRYNRLNDQLLDKHQTNKVRITLHTFFE